MEDHDLAAHLSQLIEDCEEHLDQQEPARRRALEYYDGVMADVKHLPKRSSVTSRDVRAMIKKVLPSVMRTFFAGDKVVEFLPEGPEDEEAASQATDYVNRVVIPECGAETAIKAAISDAMLLKTGILKWCVYERQEAVTYSATDQSDESVIGILDDPDIELVEHSVRPETDPAVLDVFPDAMRHDYTIRKMQVAKDIRLEAVPRGSFLIMPDAESIEDSAIVGERQEITRSDLIARGYDARVVNTLPCISARDDERDDGQARKGDDYTRIETSVRKAMQKVEIYELFARIDADGDGVAELHRVVMADQGADDETKMSRVVLEREEVEEAPYAAVRIEEEAHQFEGRSIFEDIEDIQRIKTVLLRATLDNLNWQNNPAVGADYSAVLNPDELTSMDFGTMVWMQQGRSINEALQVQRIPFFAAESFQMLGAMDEIAQDRTGITDASGGVDPEGFVNMTATAAQLLNDSGIAQADMMIGCLAKGGIRKAFKGLYKLVVAHADRPRTVRLRGQWVEYNPAFWSASLDCVVNTGLGAGTRERDMAMLQMVKQLQTELISHLGNDNPFVKPEQVYNMLAKFTEVAGFPSPDPFFTEPDPQDIQRRMEAAANQPDPAIQEMQAQLAMERETTQLKIQANRDKEQAQMQADMQVKMAEIEAKRQADEAQLVLQREKMAQEREIALAKIEGEIIKAREMAQRPVAAPVPDIMQGGLNG